MAAIHPEPTLALCAVFRRVLTITLGPDLLDDPATWALAGLLDAPTEEELELDARAWTPDQCAALGQAAGAAEPAFDAACDAWARALLDEARLRIADTPGAEDVARDVLALRGTITLDPESVEVRLPFSRSYEALLRAGLSFDLDRVPWLDERPLRFVFGNREEG